MTSGCAMICSPWKPNSRASVARSANSDTGPSAFRRQSSAACPVSLNHILVRLTVVYACCLGNLLAIRAAASGS